VMMMVVVVAVMAVCGDDSCLPSANAWAVSFVTLAGRMMTAVTPSLPGVRRRDAGTVWHVIVVGAPRGMGYLCRPTMRRRGHRCEHARGESSGLGVGVDGMVIVMGDSGGGVGVSVVLMLVLVVVLAVVVGVSVVLMLVLVVVAGGGDANSDSGESSDGEKA
jgi:hypothetical protein